MAEPTTKPSLFSSMRPLISLVMAITALVTAATSLVKALDKRLEQASYEALSKSITDLQKDQASLHVQLLALRSDIAAARDRDGDGVVDVEEPIACPVPASSVSVSVAPKLSASPASPLTHKVAIKKLQPAPTVSAVPAPTLTAAPPPKWSDVIDKADKL
jgi:hypothetical protein